MAENDFASPQSAEWWDGVLAHAEWDSIRPHQVRGAPALHMPSSAEDAWWWKLRDEQRAVVRLRNRGMTWGEIAARLHRDRAGCYRSWKRAMAKHPEPGSLPAPSGTKENPKGRVCPVPGCATILSVANPGPCCSHHRGYR